MILHRRGGISSSFASSLLLSLLFSGVPAGAGIVLDEQFNGPAIDPSWVVSTSSAYVSSDVRIDQGRLYVDRITPTHYGPDGGFAYASVTFTRSFTELDDFTAELDLSYRQSSAAYMQRSQIVVTDASGFVLGGLFFEDGWANPADAAGSGYWTLFANGNIFTYSSGRLGTSNWNRDLSLVFSRTGSSFNALINGGIQVNGAISTSRAAKVAITFGFYAYNGNVGFGQSVPGPQWVDRVRITGTVPEPGTLRAMALGLLGLARMRRSRR
ncbi:MAG: PEP-CTERM sorting domain-containing protein [Isosphaeraceae bacterium]|nr:PEP-CTERM sorting domain-containing protein [Isosphaeraceae bacterium]